MNQSVIYQAQGDRQLVGTREGCDQARQVIDRCRGISQTALARQQQAPTSDEQLQDPERWDGLS